MSESIDGSWVAVQSPNQTSWLHPWG